MALKALYISLLCLNFSWKSTFLGCKWYEIWKKKEMKISPKTNQEMKNHIPELVELQPWARGNPWQSWDDSQSPTQLITYLWSSPEAQPILAMWAPPFSPIHPNPSPTILDQCILITTPIPPKEWNWILGYIFKLIKIMREKLQLTSLMSKICIAGQTWFGSITSYGGKMKSCSNGFWTDTIEDDFFEAKFEVWSTMRKNCLTLFARLMVSFCNH